MWAGVSDFFYCKSKFKIQKFFFGVGVWWEGGGLAGWELE